MNRQEHGRTANIYEETMQLKTESQSRPPGNQIDSAAGSNSSLTRKEQGKAPTQLTFRLDLRSREGDSETTISERCRSEMHDGGVVVS